MLVKGLLKSCQEQLSYLNVGLRGAKTAIIHEYWLKEGKWLLKNSCHTCIHTHHLSTELLNLDSLNFLIATKCIEIYAHKCNIMYVKEVRKWNDTANMSNTICIYTSALFKVCIFC